MAVHRFTLILDQDPGPFADQLEQEGCPDAIFRIENGVPVAHFFREAPTLQRAMATATRSICATGLDVVGVGTVASPTNDR